MNSAVKKARIWELDAFRGICIIGMVIVHIIWDLENIFLEGFDPPFLYDAAIGYGGLLFIFLSGVCVTLGRSSAKRGAVVLAFALAVTAAFEMLRLFDRESFYGVYFGILHLLGTCMLLYPLFKRLPLVLTAVLALVFIWIGFYFKTQTTDFAPLLVLGYSTGVGMSDFFPLFPNLGYFLLGSVIGRTVYKEKKSLLPSFPYQNPLCRGLMLCGRQSLFIYILHQPLVFGVLWIIFKLL